MRKWTLSLLLAAVLLAGAVMPARAQTGTTQPGANAPTVSQLETLEIDLWPEYDQPTMLVIYHLFLTADNPLPATLTLRMPAAAGEPNSVATREQDGQLYDVTYKTDTQDAWNLVTFTTTSREIQFEYYDPALVKDGAKRSYTYEWQGDIAVKALNMQVQQPVGASQMTITPSLGSGIPGEGELVYYNARVGEVKAGTRFKLDLAYQKETDALSESSLAVQPSAPISPETPGRSSNNTLAIILGLAGLVLLVGGGVWYWQSGRMSLRPEGSRPAEAARRRHGAARVDAARSETSKAAAARGAAEGDGEAIYCHQCGTRANPGDQFCRTCGTRLQ